MTATFHPQVLDTAIPLSQHNLRESLANARKIYPLLIAAALVIATPVTITYLYNSGWGGQEAKIGGWSLTPNPVDHKGLAEDLAVISPAQELIATARHSKAPDTIDIGRGGFGPSVFLSNNGLIAPVFLSNNDLIAPTLLVPLSPPLSVYDPLKGLIDCWVPSVCVNPTDAVTVRARTAISWVHPSASWVQPLAN